MNDYMTGATGAEPRLPVCFETQPALRPRFVSCTQAAFIAAEAQAMIGATLWMASLHSARHLFSLYV